MTKQLKNEAQLIEAIFGPAPEPTFDNGSEGVSDDRFSKFESAQDAIEYA